MLYIIVEDHSGLIGMPSVIVYIPNDIYEELVYEAREKGVSVPKLISLIVRTYYELRKEKKIPYSP